MNGLGEKLSLYRLLTKVYPDFEWLPWKFAKVPANFWSDVKNQRSFLDWVAKEFKHKDLSDWYNVNTQVISHHISI